MSADVSPPDAEANARARERAANWLTHMQAAPDKPERDARLLADVWGALTLIGSIVDATEQDDRIDDYERGAHTCLIAVEGNLVALADALAAAEGRERALREALECEHNRNVDADPETLWEYVEHEGKTWNRCRSCRLLELWEGGMFVRVAVAEAGGPHEQETAR